MKLPHSFIRSLSRKKATNNLENTSGKIFIPVKNGDKSNEEIIDKKRRTFLKSIGGVGIGAAILSLLPTNHAEALVMGGTPATSVVGMKNAANTRVNPATEDTLGGIKTATDKFQFDASNNLKVITAGGGSGGASGPIQLEDYNSNIINPATDDGLVYLRRMVKLMESQAAVDAANRQRVAVETLPAITIAATQTLTTVTTVATVSTLTNIGSWDARQMFQDQAHNVYANSIRRALTFN